MCAEFHVKTTANSLLRELGFPIENLSSVNAWDFRVKFTARAPVLIPSSRGIQLSELVFPANPFPNSRLSQVESNKRKGSDIPPVEDQIVRIYDTSLWKTSFERFPCIVPMTFFCEAAYWGSHQGEVIEFRDLGSAQTGSTLFVPAIVIKPRVPATGKLNGFSLLTHTASEQMLEYHHRLLMFLKPKDVGRYLDLGEVPADERYQFLLAHRYVPAFKATVDRKMARGWEKRVERHLHALKDEKRYVSALAAEGAVG